MVFFFFFFFPFFSAFEKNNENEKNNVCQNLKKKKNLFTEIDIDIKYMEQIYDLKARWKNWNINLRQHPMFFSLIHFLIHIMTKLSGN